MQLAAIIAVSLGSLLTGAVLGDLAKKFQQRPKVAKSIVVAPSKQQLEGGKKPCAMCGQTGAVPQKCGCMFHEQCYAPFSSGAECPVCSRA
jgi:hypothetical protein